MSYGDIEIRFILEHIVCNLEVVSNSDANEPFCCILNIIKMSQDVTGDALFISIIFSKSNVGYLKVT